MAYNKISLHVYILNHPDQKTRKIYPLASSSFPKYKWQNPSFRIVELNSLQTASIQKELSTLENITWLTALAWKLWCSSYLRFSSIQSLIMSDSLRPHESQHARPPCPSPTPEVHSDSRPLSQWCHPALPQIINWDSHLPLASGNDPTFNEKTKIFSGELYLLTLNLCFPAPVPPTVPYNEGGVSSLIRSYPPLLSSPFTPSLVLPLTWNVLLLQQLH